MSDQNLVQGATEMEDLLKQGKTKEFSDRLRSDYTSMSTDDFRQFMHNLNDLNKADRAANANLPGLELHETSVNGTEAIQRVELTTPGKVFGNYWRNSQAVIAGSLGSGMLSHTESIITGARAQLNDSILDSAPRNVPIEQQH
jgi:hypothetical protein